MPRRARAVAVLVALAAGACGPGESQRESLPPFDRLYYPLGVATTPVTGGTALLVGSINFDLRYSATDGGTLLSLAPDASVGGGALAPAGAVRLGSYAGPVTVADSNTCKGVAAPVALVASRYDGAVYRFDVGADGSLACGAAGCAWTAPKGFSDPYAFGLACRTAGRRAYVGFLHPPTSTLGTGLGAWVAELDLDAPAVAPRLIEMGDGPVRALAYDAAGDRLWATTRSSDARALLLSVNLSDPRWTGAAPWQAVDAVDLFPAVRGAELKAIAVGTATPTGATRLYVTARIYDADSQASTGSRPSVDVGGVLLVLDATVGLDGRAEVAVRDVVPLGLGAGELAVLKRTAGDLVVVSVTDESQVAIYDAGAGAVARYTGRNPTTGAPVAGHRPMGVAVARASAGSNWWAYVADFDDRAVSRIEIDPANPATPLAVERIGGLLP